MKKIIFGSGVLLLLVYFVSLLLDEINPVKPALILGMACFAYLSNTVEKYKGFTYSLWIITAVCISMSYPSNFVQIGDFELKTLIVPLLQIIMFGMGSQMSLSDLVGVIKMPKGVIIGVLCQFTIMPIVGYLVTTVFNFPPEIAAGIILVGCSPGGLASNVMAFIAKANLALSITITAVATLLSPILTPFLMQIFAGELVEMNVFNMMVSIFKMVILPICAGLIFNLFVNNNSTKDRILQMVVYLGLIVLKSYIASLADPLAKIFTVQIIWDALFFAALPIVLAYVFKLAAKGGKSLLSPILSVISMVGIAVIIMVITAAGRDSLLTIGLALVAACFIHNCFGYALGYGMGFLFKLPEQDRRTIAIEVGMQNGGLASGLAAEMGKMATVGLAPSVFGPLMNITGSTLASWWRRRIPEAGKTVEKI